VREAVEARATRHIEDDRRPIRIPRVERSERAELFRAGRVPNLEGKRFAVDLITTILSCTADRRRSIRVKGVVRPFREEARLAHGLVAEENKLDLRDLSHRDRYRKAAKKSILQEK
jgi:hypothetical protein